MCWFVVWVLMAFVLEVSFPVSFIGMRILDLSALCVHFPFLPAINRTSHASCSYLTSGNNVRPHLISTFERWPYNQMYVIYTYIYLY